ncbi:MAG: exodeoxyribonuclease I [Pseudomonadales bacterium]|nr:exodeoxyribonuclease I [Pseudomonadales bacterium]
MQESIYWYDLETTGIDAARDRAIQFAGVRTDLDLNVISESTNLFSLPSNDIVPHPEAILVTGIDFNTLVQDGMSEVRFCDEIIKEFSVPGTCVAGFNSIRFDDEFTRNLFYRNFHDPYAREWQHGNSRWDVIDFFRLAHALRPDGFQWPVNESGVPSFRLEKLTEVNGIGHDSAHDAVSDVLATIEVVKALRKAQPKLFDYMYALRKKNEVVRQLYPLGKNALVHISSMYPARQNCLSIVLPICVHPTNSNGIICFDLTKDPQALLELNPIELNKRLFTSQAELSPERIPLKTIHVNKCPAIAPLGTLKGQEERLQINLDQCFDRMRQIQTASGITEKIHEAFLMSEFKAHHDPDLMLYQGGFFSDSDRSLMNEIQRSTPENLSAFGAQFQDPRLPEMLFRYRARNFPDVLTDKEKKQWQAFRENKFKASFGPMESVSEIEKLRNEGKGASCLDTLETYLLDLMSLNWRK